MSGAQQQAKLSRQQTADFGLPEDFQTYSANPFGSMNQQDARTAMDDNEFFWLENFILTGKGSLRTLWDIGPALYTRVSTATIVYFQWFNIGKLSYCAVFLSDGTAVQVAYPGGAITTMSSVPGTFYSGTQLPVACQSGEQYLLISNNITANNYWIWDGGVLYAAGTIGPYQIGDITDSGTGYTSAPTVTFYGGAGTGATGTAQVTDGNVVSITVTNPGTGYDPGDQVQVAFSGGGSDSNAILTATLAAGTIDHLELISGGTGYTSNPTVSITGGGGSGATATAVETAGVVTSLTITAPGSGYTSTPTVAFSGGGGTGASAVAVLSPGAVTSVVVTAGGSGYTGTPALTFVGGGGGTGAAATAVLAAGAISSVTLTAGGSGYTSVPTVQVSTGFNNAATASIDVMPFGISGTSIETFQSRVWISNPAQIGALSDGGTFNVSAPESLTDFASADGGTLFTSSDRFLRAQYVALHQSNGYLYPIGDSSVSVISNVQTSGTPTATTFNYQNTSAQIGGAWRDTVQDYGQAVLFANANGIMGLYGGAVQKISKKLDTLFANAVFPPTTGAVTPSGGVANIYTIPTYFLNLTLKDPTTKTTRTVMLFWDEKNFGVASQASNMTFINTQEVYSVMTCWGTDGIGLFPMFNTPSSTLSKKIVTKAFASEMPFITKEALAIYIRATDNSTGQLGIPITVTIDSSGIATQDGEDAQLPSYSVSNVVQPNFLAPLGTEPVYGGQTPGVPGTALGATLTSTADDFTISDLVVAYRRVGAQFG